MKDIRPPIQDAPPPIEMSEVTVGAMRDNTQIVARGLSWRVESGDYWVIAGLQGAGKTDFLFMTGGLMAPVSGVYNFFGESMPIFEDARLATRLRLGLVFDGGQLFNHLTVCENIALPLRYHRHLQGEELQERVRQLLTAMELDSAKDCLPSDIGRNWRKRAGLARALSLEPEVLLVDNPLGGLDLRHLNWWLSFLDLLGHGHPLLSHKPVTLVVTASDLRPWQGHARQFATLKDTRFIPLGSLSDLQRAQPEHVRELLF